MYLRLPQLVNKPWSNVDLRNYPRTSHTPFACTPDEGGPVSEVVPGYPVGHDFVFNTESFLSELLPAAPSRPRPPVPVHTSRRTSHVRPPYPKDLLCSGALSRRRNDSEREYVV